MQSAKFQNSKFIPALNALAALVMWIKPGLLSFRFAQLRAAIEPTAVRIEKEHQGLIDELVLWDIQEQPRNANGGGIPADDRERKRRTRVNEQGVTVYDFGSNQKEFERRFRELMDGESEITYTRLITESDIESIEKMRIDQKRTKDKDGNVQVAELPPVDFAALMPFMEPDDVERVSDKPITAGESIL